MYSSGEASGGRRPEKSNFALTCNLLSRYIKEKGSLRDLNLEIGGKIRSIVKPGSAVLSDKGKSKEKHSSIYTLENTMTSKEATTAESSQLTIFYSGKVLVFDDYPADKTEQLLSFAKKQSSQMCCGILHNTPLAPTPTPREGQGLPPRPQTAKETAGQNEANASDLPIARRSSLHRFLEKRKDRAAVRGPYNQAQEPASSSKGDEELELKL